MKTALTELPSQEYLKECFFYNSFTGVLLWKERPEEHFLDKRAHAVWNAKYSGRAAGSAYKSPSNKTSYLRVNINNRSHQVHRVIWKLMYGEWPVQVDHIDGNGLNNKLDNLREVSPEQNCRNRPMPSNNTSGIVGVHWCRRDKVWVASIGIGGKCKKLGSFKNKQDAKNARTTALLKYGYDVNHGRIS